MEAVRKFEKESNRKFIEWMFTKKEYYMTRVYVAGKLNSDAVGYIQNMHNMIKTAKELRRLGFCVYVPCNDFLEGLVDGGFSYEDFFNNSQPWLEVSDAVYLVPGWESSKGTNMEIELAKTLNKPIFTNFNSIVTYYGNSNKD